MDLLKEESVGNMREVVLKCEDAVMLYAVGKGSSFMLEWPLKPLPFPAAVSSFV